MRMNRKAQLGALGIIFGIFIVILIASPLIQETFNQQNKMTDKQRMHNETVSLSTVKNAGAEGDWLNVSVNLSVDQAPTGWKQTKCPLSNIVIMNSSGTIWTSATDYILDTSDGNLAFLNTTATWEGTKGSNSTYVSYDWCEDGYNTNSGSRGVARQIGLFAVLALVVFVAGYAWYKKSM